MQVRLKLDEDMRLVWREFLVIVLDSQREAFDMWGDALTVLKSNSIFKTADAVSSK